MCVSSKPTDSAPKASEEAPQPAASPSPVQQHGSGASPRSQVRTAQAEPFDLHSLRTVACPVMRGKGTACRALLADMMCMEQCSYPVPDVWCTYAGLGLNSDILARLLRPVIVSNGVVLSQVGHGMGSKDGDLPSTEATPDQRMPPGCAAAEATSAAAYQALLDAAMQGQGSGQWAGVAGQGAADGSAAGARPALQRQGSRKRKHSCEYTEPAPADGSLTCSASAEVQR